MIPALTRLQSGKYGRCARSRVERRIVRRGDFSSTSRVAGRSGDDVVLLPVLKLKGRVDLGGQPPRSTRPADAARVPGW
jgi:hypothetical protein